MTDSENDQGANMNGKRAGLFKKDRGLEDGQVFGHPSDKLVSGRQRGFRGEVHRAALLEQRRAVDAHEAEEG